MAIPQRAELLAARGVAPGDCMEEVCFVTIIEGELQALEKRNVKPQDAAPTSPLPGPR